MRLARLAIQDMVLLDLLRLPEYDNNGSVIPPGSQSIPPVAPYSHHSAYSSCAYTVREDTVISLSVSYVEAKAAYRESASSSGGAIRVSSLIRDYVINPLQPFVRTASRPLT